MTDDQAWVDIDSSRCPRCSASLDDQCPDCALCPECCEEVHW